MNISFYAFIHFPTLCLDSRTILFPHWGNIIMHFIFFSATLIHHWANILCMSQGDVSITFISKKYDSVVKRLLINFARINKILTALPPQHYSTPRFLSPCLFPTYSPPPSSNLQGSSTCIFSMKI